jgi:RNA 2',3'-cyclic 3'-phosphodiesterase
MRLFAALMPPAPVREHLIGALEPFRASTGLALRWTEPENWHITCAFYGNVPEGAIDDLTGHLAEVAHRHAPLDLTLRGAGDFSGRSLWIGVGGRTRELADLLADCVLDEEERARQRAHLTVARVSARGRAQARNRRTAREGARGQAPGPGRRDGDRRGRGRDPVLAGEHGVVEAGDLLENMVHALSVYEGPAWTATEISLVSSRPGEGRGGGSLYEEVVALPLLG